MHTVGNGQIVAANLAGLPFWLTPVGVHAAVRICWQHVLLLLHVALRAGCPFLPLRRNATLMLWVLKLALGNHTAPTF